jgi:hypothetical protein
MQHDKKGSRDHTLEPIASGELHSLLNVELEDCVYLHAAETESTAARASSATDFTSPFPSILDEFNPRQLVHG